MNANLRKAVFFTLVLGLIVVGYQCMIKPASKNLAEANTRVDMKFAKIGEYQKATAAAEDLTKQLEQLEEAIAFFESRLPPKSKIHPSMNAIAKLVPIGIAIASNPRIIMIAPNAINAPELFFCSVIYIT